MSRAAFEPPTIARRGQIARLMAQAQQHKPEHGEKAGSLRCVCGATLHFNIQSTGVSRGQCTSACGIRWVT